MNQSRVNAYCFFNKRLSPTHHRFLVWSCLIYMYDWRREYKIYSQHNATFRIPKNHCPLQQNSKSHKLFALNDFFCCIILYFIICWMTLRNDLLEKLEKFYFFRIILKFCMPSLSLNIVWILHESKNKEQPSAVCGIECITRTSALARLTILR